MELKGLTAIVTGGASGLGEACVRRFVASGANAIIADLNEERGKAVAAELGDSVRFHKTNVTDENDAESCVQLAKDEFGGLHILVNCAGIATAQRTVGRDGPMALSDFSKVINVNVVGTFNMTRLAVILMSDNDPNADEERGVVINTASVAAFEGQIGQVPYSASKGAIVAMTLPLAREFARFGVRVATIAPGIMDTPMLAGLPEPARISLGQQVPFPPRLGRPDEYAHTAQFIIENGLINGEVVRLDGAIRMAPK